MEMPLHKSQFLPLLQTESVLDLLNAGEIINSQLFNGTWDLAGDSFIIPVRPGGTEGSVYFPLKRCTYFRGDV